VAADYREEVTLVHLLAFDRVDISLSVVFAVVTLVGLADAARRPAALWRSVDRSKAAWLALILFMPGVAAVLYTATIRFELIAAEKEHAHGAA
jgi:hypothetical protein